MERSLTLTLTKDETVSIDGPAQVQLLRIQGNRIRMRFIAPRSTRILRGKVLAKIAAAASKERGDA